MTSTRRTGISARSVLYSIGDLAREFDVTLRTLRFYEDKGLVNPAARRPQPALFAARPRASQAGPDGQAGRRFSLTEIKNMLDLYDLRDGQVAQLRVALGRFNDQIALLERQKKDIEQALAELRRTTAVVSGLLKEKEAQGQR